MQRKGRILKKGKGETDTRDQTHKVISPYIMVLKKSPFIKYAIFCKYVWQILLRYNVKKKNKKKTVKHVLI